MGNYITIKVGQVEFSCEGKQEWVSDQFETFLANVPELLNLKPEIVSEKQADSKGQKNLAEIKSITSRSEIPPLPVFLEESNAKSSQRATFLATAVWLHKKGKEKLSTRDVTDALRNAKFKSLTNPSDALAKNIGKGFCEKHGNTFFVTQSGQKQLIAA